MQPEIEIAPGEALIRISSAGRAFASIRKPGRESRSAITEFTSPEIARDYIEDLISDARQFGVSEISWEELRYDPRTPPYALRGTYTAPIRRLGGGRIGYPDEIEDLMRMVMGTHIEAQQARERCACTRYSAAYARRIGHSCQDAS